MRLVILGISFLLAVIALLLNLAVPAYKSTVDVSHLTLVTIISPGNTTVTISDISPLVTCRDYVQRNVPNTTGLVPFNGTALIANATQTVETIAVSLQYTGVIRTVTNGTAQINGGNTTTRFEKRYLTLGNGAIYYVYLPMDMLYHVQVNGTFTVTLDGWTPLLYPSGGAYNATEPIFDVQRSSKIQSAPIAMLVQTKSFSYTAIRFATPTVLTVGNVVQVTRTANVW